MSDIFRVLLTDEEVEHFVAGVLKISKTKDKRRAINKIAEAERNISSYKYYSTLTHRENRDFEWRDEEKRESLRNRIIEELFTLPRLKDDDSIKIGHGGALPKSKVQAERKLIYIIGPPAAGKSGIASKIADLYGAVLLDSDYAKRKLPEYTNQIGAASLVHEESSDLIFNTNKDSLVSRCLENGYNIVIPKIGDDIQSIIEFCKKIAVVKYKVYLVSVDLDRQKATERAYHRYLKTGRYVPLSMIFDKYSNQPTLNYFYLKQRNSELFSGFAQFSTDVPLGTPPICCESIDMDELKMISWRD